MWFCFLCLLRLKMKANVNFTFITTVLLYLNIVSVIGQDQLEFVDKQTAPFKIPEDTTEGTTILTVNATGGSGELSYTVLPEGPVEVRKVDRNSVDILLKQKLMHNKILTFVCYVEDEQQNRIQRTFHFSPTDVNDHDPVFGEYNATIEIKENEYPENKLAFALKATDTADSNLFGTRGIVFELKDALLYDTIFTTTSEIIGNEAIFSVYMKEQFDFEKAVMYRLTVTAFDNKKMEPYKEASATIVINVQDVDDNGPVFTKIPSFTKLDENTAEGVKVFDIRAEDGDRNVQNPIKYSITKGNYENAFRIDEATGSVYVVKSLDRETMQDAEIILEIKAEEDNLQIRNSTSVNCTISIQDVNDEAPEFKNQKYFGKIAENSFGNTAVDLDGFNYIQVSDLDQSKNAAFNVRVTTHNDLFQLVPSEGISEAYLSLRLTNSAKLDFELLQADNPLIVTMEAVDTNDNTLKSHATVAVTILDENDLTPQFEHPTYKARVIENSPISTLVLTVSATDDDTGVYGTAGIQYFIDGNVPFAVVDPSNGEISVSGPLDRETTPVYTFTVVARDNDGTGRSSSVQVVIEIDDYNDNAPKFTQTVYKVAVEENKNEFLPPFHIKAEDADLGDNGKVVYRIKEIIPDPRSNILKLDNDYFHLTSPGPDKDVQLMISDASRMDYEQLCKGVPKTCSLDVVIEAADQGTPPETTQKTVQVLLIDMNDEIPTFTKEKFTVELLETATSGTPVETVSAIDADVSENFRKLKYQFTGDGSTEAFHIDTTSGAITVGARANLDLGTNTTNSLLLSVIANDGIYREVNNVCEIHVTIKDVNNKRPYFTENSYETNILESAAVSDQLSLQLSAKDSDEDHELRYSFGNIKAFSPDDREFADKTYVDKLFAIDANSGSISVASELDRETVHKLIVTLIVTDMKTVKGEKSATAPLTIFIDDVNDNDPVFGRKEYKGFVDENSPTGTEIRPVVTAVDSDVHLTPPTFSLAGDEKHFQISSDGLITVASNIDREEFLSFDLTVVATDDGQPPRSSSVVYRVEVVDVNDNEPEFDPDTYAKSISEGASVDTLVLQVTATDKDTGKVYYAFDKAEDLGYLRIDENTGEIFVASTLDRDAGTTSLKLRVLARDSAVKTLNTQTGTATVIVTLLDENDNSPVIIPHSKRYEVNEVHSLPHNVVVIRGTDPDEGVNGQIIFSLADNNTDEVKDFFDIEPLADDENAAMLFVKKSLEHKVQDFEIIVTAKDKGTVGRTTQKVEIIKVRVLDANNNDPVIHYPKTDDKIGAKEDLAVGGKVFEIKATDDDVAEDNKRLVYYIKPPLTDIFEVDDAGIVTLLRKFNREKTAFYRLDLEVCDFGKPDRKCTLGKANIVVQSVHDKEPYFKQPTQTLQFREETEPGKESKTIDEAVDDDNNFINVPKDFLKEEVSMPICYFIIPVGDGVKAFKLGLKDRKLQNTISLDHEETKKFVLYIKATNDCENMPSMNVDKENLEKNYLTLTIEVLDVNDNPPKFTQRVFGGGIVDNSATTDHVLKLEANDTDEGENARLGFYIDSDISVEGENMAADGNKNEWFSVDEETGVLRSNHQFGETVKGYVEFRVKVNNTKDLEESKFNHTYDTASVKIYILRNDQKSSFVFRKSVAEFQKFKDAFTTTLSNLTGTNAYINAIRSYIDPNTGMTRPEWCTVSVHYVDEANNVMNPTKIEDGLHSGFKALDQLAKEFDFKEVDRKSDTLNSELNPVTTSIYAVCAALILLLTAFLSLYCNRVSKLKLQLKASNLSTYSQANRKQSMAPEMPTTNLHAKAASNPIYDIDEVMLKETQDTLSIASEGSLVNNQTDFEGGVNNRGFVGLLENIFGDEPVLVDTNSKSNDNFSFSKHGDSIML